MYILYKVQWYDMICRVTDTVDASTKVQVQYNTLYRDTLHLAGAHRDPRNLRVMNGAFWERPYQ